MTSRSRTFAGSSSLTAAFKPTAHGNLHFLREGPMYLGPQFFTNRTARYNPQRMIAAGEIKSGNIGIAAEIRHGKGVLMKSGSVQLAGSISGVANGEYVKTRMRVNDNKLEAGTGEWSKVTEFRLRKPTVLATLGRINVFDARMGMTASQEDQLAYMMFNDPDEVELDHTDQYLLQVIMHLIRKDKVSASLEWIGMQAKNFTWYDEHEYLSFYNQELRSTHQELLATNQEFRKRFENVMARETDPTSADNQLSLQRLRASGDKLHAISKMLTSGTYGHSFGIDNSIYDILSDEYVHLDWEGMSSRAANLLNAVLRFWETAGARMDSGAHLTAPHYVFHDEQGSELSKSLSYAILRAEQNRKVRATHTIHHDMVQYFDDMLKLGGPGTPLQRQGEIMHRGIAAWFIGKQPHDEQLLHAITQAGATDSEAEYTTMLETGQWGFLVPGSNMPMEWFSHRLLPHIVPLVDSTSAARRVAERSIDEEEGAA